MINILPKEARSLEDILASVMASQDENSVEQTNSKFIGRLACRTENEVMELLVSKYVSYVRSRNRMFVADQDTKEALKVVLKWLYTPEIPGLLLYGAPGTGKTSMLHAVQDVFRADRSSFDVVDVTPKFLVDCKLETPGRFTDCMMAPVLLIDDLCRESRKCLRFGMDLTPIQDVLEYRYNRQLITMITSNFDEYDMKEIYDAYIWDRIEESYFRKTYRNDSYRVKYRTVTH